MILQPAESITIALAALALRGGTFGQQAGFIVAKLEADGFRIVRADEPAPKIQATITKDGTP